MKRGGGRGPCAPAGRNAAAAARLLLLPEPQRLGRILLNRFRTPLLVTSSTGEETPAHAAFAAGQLAFSILKRARGAILIFMVRKYAMTSPSS